MFHRRDFRKPLLRFAMIWRIASLRDVGNSVTRGRCNNFKGESR